MTYQVTLSLDAYFSEYMGINLTVKSNGTMIRIYMLELIIKSML